jgi:Zn-dependent protease with chaperone function
MGAAGTTEAVRPSAADDWGLIAAMIVFAHPIEFVFSLAIVGVLGFVGGLALLAPLIVWTVFAVVTGLMDRDQLSGRAIRPADEPELTALVQAVAERLDIRAPLLVRLVPVPDAALSTTKVAGVRVFVLELGWPLLRRMTCAQLAAVVAHELAHELHVADRRTSWLLRARESLAESLDNRVHVPVAVAGILLRATQARSWDRESAADVSSAEVAGSSAVRSALQQTGSIGAAFEILGERWASALAEDDCYPQDLYDALDVALDDPCLARQMASTFEAMEAAEALHPYAFSSHPSLAARVAAVPELPGGDWDASGPVRIREGAVLDQWCVQTLVGPEEPGQLRPVRVLDCEPERFDLPADKAYTALVEATGHLSIPDAITAAVDAITDGSWMGLARAIDPELGSVPSEMLTVLSRESFVSCLGRAVSGRLLDAGWQRASRWTTRVVVSPDGDDVDVRELIERAVVSANPGEVRLLLALANPPAPLGSPPVALVDSGAIA